MIDSTATAAKPAPNIAVPFEFRATGGEYFRIWIVNLLLTILTLGIYSAWAKVRRLRYLYGSTSLAGSAFEYHGEPLQILKGRLIAVAVFGAYAITTRFWPKSVFVLLPVLILLLPLVVVFSRRFQMRMTSWRGIRFGFHGRYPGAFVAYVAWGIVAIVTLYLLLPLWLYKRIGFLVDNTSLGTHRFEFTAWRGRFFGFYYATLGLMVAAFLALILLGALFGGAAGSQDGPPSAAAMAGLGTAFVVGIIAVALVVGAFWERSFTNAAYDGIGLGPHRLTCRIRMGRLLWLYATNVVGVLLTLGLFYPWALIRRLRYQFECMAVECSGSLDEFAAAAAPPASATGEAIGESFDLDFGL
jgi:uncharacterized membrane protein YjgN (DUF898 family)